jgi:hypothetical protein
MQWEYQGRTIQVSEDHGLFRIVPDRWKYSSLLDAQAEIDKEIKAAEAQARVKLAIPLLDDAGKPVTVTGIHGGHYKPLGIGNARDLYPTYPAVEKLLRERTFLRKRLQEIDDKVSRCRISGERPYGVKTHAEAVAAFERQVAIARERAQQEFGAVAPDGGASAEVEATCRHRIDRSGGDA